MIDGCEPETFLFNYSCASGDEDWETLHERVPDTAALRAEVERLREGAEKLLDAAEAVVQRWDSPDWKSGHTLDFITRLRHACAEMRKGEKTE